MDLKKVIISQYHAALAMLRQAVIECPDPLWNAPEPANKFWQVAYHTLFYTHLYLQDTVDDFTPWEKHRDGYESMGHLPEQPEVKPLIDEPYTKGDVLEYLEFCQNEVYAKIMTLDLESEVSGFHWLPFGEAELQFYNIRHLQHHTGELAERLGTRANIDVDWVGMGRGQGD